MLFNNKYSRTRITVFLFTTTSAFILRSTCMTRDLCVFWFCPSPSCLSFVYPPFPVCGPHRGRFPMGLPPDLHASHSKFPADNLTNAMILPPIHMAMTTSGLSRAQPFLLCSLIWMCIYFDSKNTTILADLEEQTRTGTLPALNSSQAIWEEGTVNYASHWRKIWSQTCRALSFAVTIQRGMSINGNI